MKTKVFVLNMLTIASLAAEVGCSGWDPTKSAQASTGVSAAGLSEERATEGKSRGESSPFLAGVWKFVQGAAGTPTAETEFRFINPTASTVRLEYAFFQADGTFCGCDRDTLPPGKTTTYTVLGESQTASPAPDASIPFQFACSGTSGALQAFVFKNRGEEIFLDDATQVGFQTHAFGTITETPDGNGNFNFLLGSVMTESAMQGIAITDATLANIRSIHQQCVGIQGPLAP